MKEEMCINAFRTKISVVEKQKEPLEEKHPESSEDIPNIPLSELNVLLDSAQSSQEILDVLYGHLEQVIRITLSSILMLRHLKAVAR